MDSLHLTQEVIDTKRLAVEIFGKQIPSPLILGSGTLIEEFDEIYPFLAAGVGAVVPRSTRKILARKSHPVPHLHQSGTKKFPTMINAEWTGADIAYWRPYLATMAANQRTIMSISGRDISDCVEVCKELDRYVGWLYFEINVSCAHSNNVHGMITRNAAYITNIMSSLKDAGLSTPIAIKLGYSDGILELANVAKEAGADAIVALNTYGPVFDFNISENGKPQAIVGIEGGKGGLSGAPLFPIALTAIAEIKRQIDITVIGCGGVQSAESAVKMMMAGADAVQVYTAAHVRGVRAPSYFNDANVALLNYMNKHNIHAIADVVGSALSILEQNTQLEVSIPTVNERLCIGCDLCIPICLPQAITIKADSTAVKGQHVVQIDEDKCIGCGHCIPICPTQPKSLNFNQRDN